jgi:hypothetical protein
MPSVDKWGVSPGDMHFYHLEDAAAFLGFTEQLFCWCMQHTDDLFIVQPDVRVDKNPWHEAGPVFHKVTLLEFSARLAAAGFMVTGDGTYLVDMEKIETGNDLEIIERRLGQLKHLP